MLLLYSPENQLAFKDIFKFKSCVGVGGGVVENDGEERGALNVYFRSLIGINHSVPPFFY